MKRLSITRPESLQSGPSLIGTNDSEWSKRSLQEALFQLLEQASENVCIFVDGLDEYTGKIQDLLIFFQTLPKRGGSKHGLKVCLASRPEPMIALALEHCPGFRMQDHNLLGIEQYISMTMAALNIAVQNESQMKRFSSTVAQRAEGIFLWARFAISEVVSSYADGEDISETLQRLDNLPSGMEELYARIMGRMSSKDRQEARLMFQLVCFAQELEGEPLNLTQLEEAIAIANGKTLDVTQRDTPDALTKFRRRMRAKSGGLLEETEDTYQQQKRTSMSGGTVKLVHRTVEKYLESQRLLIGCQLSTGESKSPNALWLWICCKCVGARSEKRDPQQESSLLEYAHRNLFWFARRLEDLCEESCYEYLSLVPSSTWGESPLWIKKNNGYVDYCRRDWDALKQGHQGIKRTPWQIIVAQGLVLACKDAITRNQYSPDSHCISLALLCFDSSRFYPKRRCSRGNPFEQLISILILSGATVTQRQIVECIHRGTPEMLNILLSHWHNGRLRLKRDSLFLGEAASMLDESYARETVGPLYELSRASFLMDYEVKFERFLDLFLARGEDVNDICGPAGTALHAAIVGANSRTVTQSFCNGVSDTGNELFIERTRNLISRGANVNVSGPRGTPLKLAWRSLHAHKVARRDYESVSEFRVRDLTDFIRELLVHGAECEWVEHDGTVVDRRLIEYWLDDVERPDEYRGPHCKSDWYTYEFPLYHDSSSTGKSQIGPANE